MESTGKYGGDSVGGMDMECTCIAEEVSYPDSSQDCLQSGLVGQGWSGALGDFLLNLSKIVADAVTSFRNMQP